MGRNEFGLGVLVGGLIGVSIGYLIKRTSDTSDEELSAPDLIDLTPALQRRSAMAAVGDVAEASE
jgi:hypothetical protein